MRKYLKALNFRIDVVVSDVCGLTGMKIIAAISEWEQNPEVLACTTLIAEKVSKR